MSGSDDIFGSGSDSDDGTAAVAQPVVLLEQETLVEAALAGASKRVRPEVGG